MGRKEAIKKEIDLSKLPKWGKGEGSGKGKPNTINWIKSISCKVSGCYEGVSFEVEIIDYIPKTHKLKIQYDNQIYYISTDNFKDCSFGKILGKITKDFKVEIGTKFQDNRRDIVVINREYRKEEKIDKQGRKSVASIKWYKCKCNKCSHQFWIIESSLLRGTNCVNCYNHHINKPLLGENIIWNTDPWMIPYVGEEIAKTYSYGSSNKVTVTCPDCGRTRENVKINDIYNSHSIGCICNDGVSYPNKFMFNFLEQLNVEFEREYSPDWVENKFYDFYIPSINIIIEMDGGFHFKDNIMSGQTKEESKDIDKEKDRLANKHGIEVIRIDCNYKHYDRFKYTKNNILNNRRLNELFNINNINWIKINDFALSNLIKIACEYKKNNPELTTTEIGKLMGFSQTGVAIWLKQGNEIGWCKYNPEEEVRISLEKGRKAKAIPVEIFKNNISQGVFPSATYLEGCSEETFGIKFVRACITNACLKKPKYLKYKGYTFNYISKEYYERRKLQEELKQVI